MGLPRNTATILRSYGLKVVEVPGWQTRCVRGYRWKPGLGLKPTGTLWHHTATPKTWSVKKVLDLLIKGRPDLSGPLANIGLGRDGTVYLIAAGRANHAGRAKASGTMAATSSGNGVYVGIEAFNDGVGEKWGREQYNAYVLLSAVINKEFTRTSVETIRGHKETSTTGKVDPFGLSMTAARKAVKAKIAAITKPKTPSRRKYSDVKIAVANVKSNPLMPVGNARSDYVAILSRAKAKGMHTVTFNEHHSSYSTALKEVAKRYGFDVRYHQQNAICTRKEHAKWFRDWVSTFLTKGIAHVSPHKYLLRYQYVTPLGTKITNDVMHMPRGWSNPKYSRYTTTRRLAAEHLRDTANIIKGQTKTGAAVVSGDMNITKEINWDQYGVSPSAVAIPTAGSALTKMMQTYVFVPKGWDANLKSQGIMVGVNDLFTDHDVVEAHFVIDRP